MLKRASLVALVILLPVGLAGAVYWRADHEIDVKAQHLLRQLRATTITSWLLLSLGIAALIVVAGWIGKGELFGALIGQQNRYSLSRLQVAMWTSVVIGVWLAIVLVRVASNIPVGNAIDVKIPDAVLVTLGISTASLVTANGIKNSKRKHTVSPTARVTIERDAVALEQDVADKRRQLGIETQAAAVAADGDKAALDMSVASRTLEVQAKQAQLDGLRKQIADFEAADGLLVKNPSPADARASDFFTGEETDNVDTLDFGKVQMLWITVAVVAAYVFALLDALNGPGLFRPGGVSLPDLPESVVALLGISHSGYLVVKASSGQTTEVKA